MSRQAEEAHERRMLVHYEECQRDLVIGARVYRVGYDQIEQGTVERIDRVRYTDGHFSIPQEVEDPTGPYVRYHAKFSQGAYGWESQTSQWRFFFKIEDAKSKLAAQLRDRAKDCRRDADKWDAMADAFEALQRPLEIEAERGDGE